jgi:DNA processing protein
MDKYLISLTYLKGLGPVMIKKLMERFNSAEAIWQASFNDFRELKLNDDFIAALIKQRQQIDPDKIVNQLNKEQIKTVSVYEQNYPKLLKEIYAPPTILFYRGQPEIFNAEFSLAVVGSRKISAYVKTVLPDLLDEIVKRKVVIISGLAYGVDELAHTIAVDNNCPTIAITGSGLAWDYLYPQSNLKLAEKIIKTGGLIVSEFSPFTAGYPANFPRRNRLISGLSKVIMVAEASAKSGALITAGCAAEQNREVLALPQNLNSPTAIGVNRLLSNGAKIITSAADILESLNIFIDEQTATKTPPADLNLLSPEEKTLYQLLSASPLHIDKIVENSTLDASAVGAFLIQLEIKGVIKNIGGQNYIKF